MLADLFFLKILATLLATPTTFGLAKIARAWLLSGDRTWKTGGDRNLIANFELYRTFAKEAGAAQGWSYFYWLVYFFNWLP